MISIIEVYQQNPTYLIAIPVIAACMVGIAVIVWIFWIARGM